MIIEIIETPNTRLSNINVTLDTNQRKSLLWTDQVRSSCVIELLDRTVRNIYNEMSTNPGSHINTRL